MKETGLMFKEPLVRAILEGRKTQTRRVVKPQPAPGQGMVNAAYCGRPDLFLRDGPCDETDPARLWRCPMGQPGDRIYVRETWSPDPPCDGTWCYTSWAGCRQGQIEGVPERFRTPEHCMYAASTNTDMVWTPSVHMPKWAARIWLEITGVRVERLQQITDADCWAEGAITEARPDQFSVHSVIATDGKAYLSPRGAFSSLWESTGCYWAENPWVWVIDFKTISTNGRPA